MSTSVTANTEPCIKKLALDLVGLLDYIEQAEREAEEGVPILKWKTETTNTTVKKEKVEAMSAVPQELAYYEGLIEEYFKNDDPTILEELGATVSQSRLAVAY